MASAISVEECPELFDLIEILVPKVLTLSPK